MRFKRVRAEEWRARSARLDDEIAASNAAAARTMPDPARRLARAPTRRTAGRPAARPDPHGTNLPHIVGGLLRGQPELRLLTEAAAGVARLEIVDDRFALVSSLLTSRPDALVVPPFDADHTSTAPLVLRVRREAPDVAVVILSSHPAGAGQPMLRAAQAGAHVITSPTAAELQAVLSTLLESQAGDQ
jgi:hypothetical protein